MQKISFDEIMAEQSIPVVAANQDGILIFVNSCFEEEYGWEKEELIGNSITTILPPHMREAHNLGFSRFLTTETERIINKEISLPVYCRDDTVRDAMHLIKAKKVEGNWQFAALIDPEK